jgi:hypothetical protein
MREEQFSDEIGLRTTGGVILGTRATARRKWYCESDAPVTSNEALTASAGGVSVAAIGEGFSVSRPTCRCRSRNVDRMAPCQFSVTASYTDATDGSSYENLLSQPARISVGYEQFMEPYARDHSDPPLPVQNTAGTPFDSLPERVAVIRVYTIKKYVDGDTKADIEAAMLTNNENAEMIDDFLHPVNTLFLAGGGFEPVDDFYEATIVVKYHPEGWKDKPLSYGFHYLDGSDLKEITVKGVDPVSGAEVDVPVTKQYPLTESGGKAASASTQGFEMTFYPYPINGWAGVPLS